jgi:hypothetical protein
MNNFYPNGAIKGKESFEKLLDQRFKKGSNLYLVNEEGNVFKIRLNTDTKVSDHDNGALGDWTLENSRPVSVFHLRINPTSDYLESSITRGYIFSNFWHAWAYANHLEQSGFAIDWHFPVGVG